MTMASTTESDVRRRYEAAGQGHVFDHYDKLEQGERKNGFLEELAAISVETIASLLASARGTANFSSSDNNDRIQPFSGAIAHSNGALEENHDNSKQRQLGLEAIVQGHVAALVLAGGQGTRLGFSGPKGMYDIQLPSHRSLFELLALRLKRLAQLAEDAAADTAVDSCKTTNDNPVAIPFYIMTSPLNHDETVSYFQSNDYFGLGVENVFFFRQGMLPCLLEDDGKIILEAAGKVAMAPDGNGGIYPSLQSSGALQNMTERGVRYLHVFSIDNALVRPADPVFVGFCIAQNADCGNKVVWKAHAHEKVGVVAERNGKPCIVEYSEISEDMAEQTDAEGRLVFGAGNICNHFYTLDFLKDTILPNMGNLYHIANKKIPYYDATVNETVTPTHNNGIKLETFIFDVFPLSKSMAVMDVQREEEFAPVKNEPGSPSDSPDTARTMISNLAKKWVVAAGGRLVGDIDDTNSICEVSPLTSYAGEGLEALVKDKEITCPFLL